MSSDPLKSALREAAAGDAPPFSPLLHEQIMSRVRAGEVASQALARSRFRWAAPLAAAASIVLFAGIYLALRPSAHRVEPAAISILSPMEITDPVDRLLTAAAPARETLDDGKYAYLDHDAQRLVFFLADQFPSPPTERGPNRNLRRTGQLH